MQLKDYDKAIELMPNYAEAYLNRGRLKFYKNPMEALKDLNRAIEVYNESFKISPGMTVFDNPNFSFSEVYGIKGIVKRNLGDNFGAIIDLSKAIRLDSNNWNYYHDRGSAFLELMDYKSAILDYEKAVIIGDSIKSGHEDSWNRSSMFSSLATAHMNLNMWQEALVDLTNSIELSPKSSYHYYERAFLYLKLKRRTEACLDFSKSGELGYELAYEKIREFCSPSFMEKLKLYNPTKK